VPDPSPIDAARDALDAARARAAAEARELEARRRAAAELAARLGPDDARVRDAERALARAARALAETRRAERAAITDLRDRAGGLISADPDDPIGPLAAEYPVVLFPVRVETRFARERTPPELWVRVYPDEILAHLHTPELDEAEIAAGHAYWREAWTPDQALAAWGRLVQALPPPRAAWAARATTPLNLAARPAGTPAFPDLVARAAGAWRPAEARLLPDRWIVLGYRDGAEVLRGVGGAILEPLALAMAPPEPDGGGDEGLVDVSGDGLAVDAESAWLMDFDRAVAAGMGLRLPLAPGDLARGFDRLLVLGVKATLGPEGAAVALGALLDDHHWSRSWAFVPQGTPTNNTSGRPTGFPPEDPGGARSFRVEQGESLATPDGDGVRFARALGVPPDVVAHVAGADGREQSRAGAMNEALWPVTWGYFLEQMMAPVVPDHAVAEARAHFVRHVRGRGPYPAFRVGATPYGLLPVTALRRWTALPGASGVDRELPGILRTLWPTWAGAVAGVPRTGRSSDPDADLLATLGLDAHTREVRVRRVTGADLQLNLRRFLGVEVATWEELQRQVARDVLAAIGHPQWNPRILSMTFADAAPRFRMPLVARPPLSETDGLPFDYIAWIRRQDSIGPVWRRLLPAGVEPPSALLYHMLRHAALLECGRLVLDVLVRSGEAAPAERREPELVRVTAGTEARDTVWDRMVRPVDGVTGNVPLADALLAPPESRPPSLAPEHARLDAYRQALAALEGVPTAELERLFVETLDVSAHRLDAWVTSLASRRLEAMRERQPIGLHVGAYGWVEDLRPAAADRHRRVTRAAGASFHVQAASGGYVHAPSMGHAATAAILRNAYLSRTGADRTRYAVDLSSRRVRRARWLLDGVRNGQPLGALLGYQLERGLHEGHPGFDLDRYIEPLRQRFPLVADKAEPSGEPVDKVAARDVVDGLALRAAWAAGTFTLGPGGLEVAPGDRPAVEAELRRLDETVDAVADLLLAEAVHQVVGGSLGGAAASLDAMAHGGARPPDPAIADLPRGGTTLTHRVALVLGDPPVPDGPWAAVPATPRARAEPRLDRWAGHLLGDPGTVRCRVSHPDPRPGDGARRGEVIVSLAELGLRPLDVLALAAAAEPEAQAAELDERVAFAAMARVPVEVDLHIEYARDPAWDRASVRTFTEVLELGRAVAALVAGARPLGPGDLQPPEAPTPPAAEGTDARTRAEDARASLDVARTTLEGAIADVRGGSPDLDALREALRAASLFGVAAAVPRTRRSAGEAARTALLAQADGVAAELAVRLARAGPATEPSVIAREIFGRNFTLLPVFAPPGAAELGQALSAGPGLGADWRDVRRWLQQAAQVRPALRRWRRLWLYAEALGRPAPPHELAQLPHRPGERWVGLAFGPGGERPPSGRLSLVMHRPAAPAASDRWAGLLIDEWPEVIPAAAETTGIAFHHDDPGAEAPQAVLIAVPPDDAARWSFATLTEIVGDTLDLAKLRGVDGELLGALGQLLPAVYLSANVKDEAVSTSFKDLLVSDPPAVITDT
jgi:hypothetical protein